jgi:hypothetical protein
MATDIDIIDGVPGSSFTSSLPGLLSVLEKYAGLVTTAWNLPPVTLHYAARVPAADPHHQWLVVNNHSPDPSMGGYHDIQPNGLPFSRVYAGDAAREGHDMLVDLTHELAEMIVDPFINRTWDDGAGKVYLIEVGDPVESDGIAIDVDGHKCSNFVFPAYYSRSGGPYDYGRVLLKPCPELFHGGYISWQESANGMWKQSFARLKDGTQSLRSRRFGRAAHAADTQAP